MIRLPQLDEYHRAVQSPGANFADPELRASRAVTNMLGMPVCDSGGFALTFRLDGGMQQWAVRCFHREVVDRQDRYTAISRFLKQHQVPFFTPIDYQPQGIRVNGRWFPITKMAWVQGVTLGMYVQQNLRTPEKLAWLPGEFVKLVESLDTLQVAHGDLQHRNLIVTGNRLVLIDYDGMYVPDLANRKSAELGLPDYQHPSRTEDDFGPQLDRFSSIVIFLSLKALAKKPDLARSYSTGENLIFQQRDFISPGLSALLAEFDRDPDLRVDAGNFRRLCALGLRSIPRLSDFLSGVLPTGTAPSRPPIIRYPYPVVNASDRMVILNHVGQRVTAVGRVVDVKRSQTKFGKPYTFINFADWRTGCFTAVLWSEALDLFAAQGVSPASLQGQWVRITGLVDIYRPGTWPDRPQMIVEMPAEIETLAGGETEAQEFMREAATPTASSPSLTSASSRSGEATTASLLPWYYGVSTTPQYLSSTPRSGHHPASHSGSQAALTAAQQAVRFHATSNPALTAQAGPSSQVQQPQPVLTVSELELDFGKIEESQSVQRTIYLINDSVVSASATIRASSAEPWLSVGARDVVCPPMSRVPVAVSIINNPPLDLGAHITSFDILGPVQTWPITVKVEVARPVMELSTSHLTVLTDREGKGKIALQVGNGGNTRLKVLSVDLGHSLRQRCTVSPNSFICEPGELRDMVVEINGRSPSDKDVDGTLTITSNAGKRIIRVQSESRSARLSVQPTEIDLGEFDGSIEVSQRLEIANAGKDLLEATVEFKDPEWLVASRYYYRLLPGESDTVDISVKPQGVVKLKLFQIRSRSLENVIKISSNGGNAAIPVKLVTSYHCRL